MKGLLLITGEAFREGLQGNRSRDTAASFQPQKMASQSHVDFCDYLKQTHGVKMDIFINTYDTKYEKELKSWYPNCKYKSTKELIGPKLVQNAVNEIEDYDFIFWTRPDIFIKPYFYSVFNPKWKTIHFFSQNYTIWHCGMLDTSPLVNPTFQFIPKNYFNVLTSINVGHESWKHYHETFNIPHSKLNFMVNTYHDTDSYKDYNPYYRYVGRPESTVWHDRGKTINRKLFGKKHTCNTKKSYHGISKLLGKKNTQSIMKAMNKDKPNKKDINWLAEPWKPFHLP